ncbi:unnamed protein product [Eruca vesicaria subsp. sativa]|uniref:MATH domain-containing protein n=1 Tax=Eruca vesicaria subsp. sativa TaxID=29727 RepID=A0ABC8IW23_ERUVS|nr:unnamed protein product [Eruca vesicaria subsp. sativa]
MAKLAGKKFTWVIKNFSSLKPKTYRSDTHEIGTTGYTCCLAAARNAAKHEGLSVHIIYCPTSHTEVRRCVKYSLTIVNQLSEELSIFGEGTQWFDPFAMEHASASVFCFPQFHDKDGGFLVNDEIKIVAVIEVLEVSNKSDIQVETEKTNKPLRKIKENDGAASIVLLKEDSTIMESIDVNGFQVFPSQVEFVRRIFEKHPDIADGFHAKNQRLRTTCMNFLLSLIETMCQSLQELSDEDLVEADIALTYLQNAGFKVDWLEKNLFQVISKKEKEISGLAMLQETEENLLEQKQKCAQLEALAEEQKKELSATRTPLSFDDVV